MKPFLELLAVSCPYRTEQQGRQNLMPTQLLPLGAIIEPPFSRHIHHSHNLHRHFHPACCTEHWPCVAHTCGLYTGICVILPGGPKQTGPSGQRICELVSVKIAYTDCI